MQLWFLYACIFYCSSGVTTTYDGNNMLIVLDKSGTSQTFKDFSNFWLLDKTFENCGRGIKVYINPITGKVESIAITGYVADLSDKKFNKHNDRLPFNISLVDDTSALCAKLGHGEKLIGRNTLKFHSGNLSIEATYTGFQKGKTSYLKFDNEAEKPLVIACVISQAKKQNRADKSVQLEQSTFQSSTVAKPKDTLNFSPFKKAILDVFKASRETAFDTIKNGPRKEGNFWNYKYTYNTRLKIPGEKYNMLYCFPFGNSQLDFVSVLKESNSYEKSFELLYHDFEKQLTANFPASEGWVATCLPGKDKTRLPDLEFRNDKYGAVILDYTKSPTGKHILYLRFLLFSD